MAKKIKTSLNSIKESRKGMVSALKDNPDLNTEFIVKYDKDYGVDRLLFGMMEVTVQAIRSTTENGKLTKKIVEEPIFVGMKVSTSNAEYEAKKALKRFKDQLKNKAPGVISIYNCKVNGKANISFTYL